MTTQISGEVIPSDVPGSLAMGVRQPPAWWSASRRGMRRSSSAPALAMPLACGNTVILKASELCPALHRLIGSVFEDAGFLRAWSTSSPTRRKMRRKWWSA
jgi:ribosomal protein L32